MPVTVNRPLKLGELLAETVRLYGERFWAAIGVGLPIAGAFAVGLWAPEAIAVAVVSLAFTLSYAAAARVAAGDRSAEAWAQTAVRLPTLLVLAVVVAVPFALAASQLYLLIVAVAWLALTGFGIPLAMLARDQEDKDWFARLGDTLYRSFELARTEYLHAFGVIAALVIVYVLVFGLLVATLVGFGENGRNVAEGIAHAVLAPFFFLGLSVLYFEQNARALSSRRE